jgi:hypothetical protein
MKKAIQRPPCAETVSGSSTVELRGNPGHAHQGDGGDNDINLQVAQPCEMVQRGIAQIAIGACMIVSFIVAHPLDRPSVVVGSQHWNPHHIECIAQNALCRPG